MNDRVILLDHPEFADRFTAIIDGECSCALSMSINPFSPVGVHMHVPVDPLWVRENMGKRIDVESAPENVQRAIRQEVGDYA